TAVQFWETFQDQSRLEARVIELESQLIYYHEALRENERLKKILDLKQSIPAKTVAAKIIGRDLSPWRKTLILDKGQSHGIVKDMMVLAPEGLVGRILEVGPLTSRVILLTDPDARVSALTADSRAQGVVAGNGSPRLQMKYLELDSGPTVGEVVLTSGIGEIFSKELKVGMVEAVSRDPDGLHLVASIRPFVPFSKLEEVLCLASSR
ncbi:MAG: rod shape-determining protein MreC, partial [Candidatus Omnitrophica bacterium]|nr:rod shape-determining protein MreC [Candidatus Omnitrophota bacterium]